MPDYQSVFDGKQIDDGIGKIINGEIDKAVLDAQTAAGQAQNALSGVTARLDVVPTGSTQIINDLTTGGAGSALSAGMGKQLKLEMAPKAIPDDAAPTVKFTLGVENGKLYMMEV